LLVFLHIFLLGRASLLVFGLIE